MSVVWAVTVHHFILGRWYYWRIWFKKMNKLGNVFLEVTWFFVLLDIIT